MSRFRLLWRWTVPVRCDAARRHGLRGAGIARRQGRVVLAVLALVLAAAPAGAAETAKHSGTISRVDLGEKTLRLQEMGPWTGPRTRLAAGWPGGYVESPLSLDQLHPGEFATVTAEEHGGKSVALAIDVVPRPSALPTR